MTIVTARDFADYVNDILQGNTTVLGFASEGVTFENESVKDAGVYAVYIQQHGGSNIPGVYKYTISAVSDKNGLIEVTPEKIAKHHIAYNI